MLQRLGLIHFYCLVVEAGFYSDVVECLPVDPATRVGFPAGTGWKIFALRHMYQQTECKTIGILIYPGLNSLSYRPTETLFSIKYLLTGYYWESALEKKWEKNVYRSVDFFHLFFTC